MLSGGRGRVLYLPVPACVTSLQLLEIYKGIYSLEEEVAKLCERKGYERVAAT